MARIAAHSEKLINRLTDLVRNVIGHHSPIDAPRAGARFMWGSWNGVISLYLFLKDAAR